MTTDTWVTLVAYDTPFLAQMVADRLDDVGIDNRTLSDGGAMLPPLSFGTGGYRVQVHDTDEGAARDAIAALSDGVMDDLDVGEFEQGAGGVRPRPIDDDELPVTGSLRRWVRWGALAFMAVIAWDLLGGSSPFGVTTILPF